MLGTALAAVLALPACGDDGGSADSRSTDGEWRLVEIVTATAAGGTVETTPEPIETLDQLDAFSRQFTRPEMARELERVWRASAPDDGTLTAAVVAIGCDEPTDVTYSDGAVRPRMPLPPMKECLAAMTSVAVISLG